MILLEKKGRMLAGTHSDHVILSVGHNTIAIWFQHPEVRQKYISVYSAAKTCEIDNKSGINDAQAVFYYITGDGAYLKQWTGFPCNKVDKAINMAEDAISIIENSGNFLKYSAYTKGDEKYGL